MIGIIGAMEVEVEKLREQMLVTEEKTFAGMHFYSGTLCGQDVVVVRSGIGKVNAAVCVQLLCDHFAVTEIWNTGIAGSLDAKIDIGDIVISSDAMQHDMDAVAFGYGLGVIPQMECSDFMADATRAAMAEAVCHQVNPDITTYIGRVVSGDQFVADQEKKNWISEHFHALCTEMEGAAIAQAAYLNQVPFLIIRAISDKADNSASMDYPEFERKAVAHMVQLTIGLLTQLGSRA